MGGLWKNLARGLPAVSDVVGGAGAVLASDATTVAVSGPAEGEGAVPLVDVVLLILFAALDGVNAEGAADVVLGRAGESTCTVGAGSVGDVMAAAGVVAGLDALGGEEREAFDADAVPVGDTRDAGIVPEDCPSCCLSVSRSDASLSP